MNTFKVNGISVNDHGGDGEPLIFIHAYPLCSRMWDEQVNFFKDKYRVITYDVRGLGYSNEIDSFQFTMEELVDDFFNILDYLKLDKVNACGLSIGGYILLRAMVRDQSKFLSVILSDTKAEGEDNESMLNRSKSIVKIKSDEKDAFLEEFIKKLLSKTGYENEKIREFVKMMISWMDAKGINGTMMAIATRTTTLYQLKDINLPVLVIAGRQDELTPVIKSFFIKEKIKNSTFKVIEDAGHLSNLEKPQEFNKAIEEFLSEIKK